MIVKLSAAFDDVIRENVFFSIYPEMIKSFLGTIQDFSQESTLRVVLVKHLLVEDLVRVRKLVTI